MKKPSRNASRRFAMHFWEVILMSSMSWSWDKTCWISSKMKKKGEETWGFWSNKPLFSNWHLCLKLRKNHSNLREVRLTSTCLLDSKVVVRLQLAVKLHTTIRRRDGELEWSVLIPSELVPLTKSNKIVLRPEYLSMEGKIGKY